MASLIHPSSSESVTSQLDLFSVPPTQTSLEDGFFTEYRPISVLTSGGPVEFCIAAESSNYIDLANTFLYVRASVTKADGTALAADTEITPECNFLHTLWSQCDLYLNDTLVTQSSNNYGYRSYIETLLSFGKDAKDSQLSSVLWYQNSSGSFDTRGAGNAGYTKRKAIAAQSHEFDMMGRLHLDMSFQSRYVLNGIEIKYRLIRAKDSFCLHGNADQAENKVSLKEVSLFCRKVKPNPSIQLAHTKALQHGTAKYPLRRVEVKTFTIPQGNRSFSKESLFLGQLPTRIVVGFVDNDAYNGNIAKSPFNFKNYDINFVCVYRDGVQIPSSPLQPDFNNNKFIRSYLRLFSQTSQYFADTGLALSRSDFGGGYTLFAFDLTPQLNSSDPAFKLIKSGNIRLEVHFAAATPRTLTAVVLAEHDNLLQVDDQRHVAFDYTA